MTSEENSKSFVIYNLANQLVDLQRRFNNLEMNRSGQTARVASNPRVIYSNKKRSRYLTVIPSSYRFAYTFSDYRQLDDKQLNKWRLYIVWLESFISIKCNTYIVCFGIF